MDRRAALALIASLLLGLWLWLPLTDGSLAAGVAAEEGNRSIVSTGDQRIGLVELFTAVWCPPCRNADLGVEHLYNELDGELAILTYHTGEWTGPGDPDPSDSRYWSNDDPFGLNASTERFSSYLPREGDRNYPTLVINGDMSQYIQGSAESPTRTAETYREQPKAKPETSQYTLTGISPASEGANRSWWLAVEGPQPTGRNLSLWVALTQDNLFWWGWNGDGTPGGSTNDIVVHRFVTRHLFEPVSFNSTNLNLSYELPLGEGWELEDMGYVAFLQDDATGEVVQSLAYYPHPPLPPSEKETPGPGLVGAVLGLTLALVVVNVIFKPRRTAAQRIGKEPQRHRDSEIVRGSRGHLWGVFLGLALILALAGQAAYDTTPTFVAADNDPDPPTNDE